VNAQYSMSQVRGSFVHYSLEHIFPDGFVPTHKGLGTQCRAYTHSPTSLTKSKNIYYIFHGFETLFST
jgi:hypothetical protein